jgi:hypothetical protein
MEKPATLRMRPAGASLSAPNYTASGRNRGVTMDMIERVAKAAYVDLMGEDDGSWPNSHFSVSADMFRSCARAAIFAMREPTPFMWVAAEDEFDMMDPKWGEKMWRAMIDEALKQPQVQGDG